MQTALDKIVRSPECGSIRGGVRLDRPARLRRLLRLSQQSEALAKKAKSAQLHVEDWVKAAGREFRTYVGGGGEDMRFRGFGRGLADRRVTSDRWVSN